MQRVLIFLVIAGGMGLSVEAGLLGPLAGQVGDLWATMSIFRHWRGINVFLLMLFLARDKVPLFFAPRLAINRWSIGAGLCADINDCYSDDRYRNDDYRYSRRSSM